MESLHAPWRIEYILGPKSPSSDLSIFSQIAQSSNDQENLVILRSKSCFALLNVYPYTGGHLMVVPYKQVPDFNDLTDDELTDLMLITRKCQNLLKKVMKPEGFNIGINLGRVAGAGIVEHLHIHIVPRWNGDTNFMPVIAGTTVVPQALAEARGPITLGIPIITLKLPMISETLHFENPRLIQQLINNDPQNLQLVEQELGVKSTSREGWIKLEGSKEGVEKARELFQLLEGNVRNGTIIKNREFAQAVAIIKNEGAPALRSLYSERIQTSTRKMAVVPKTPGQKTYVEAIREHDITFGIGPAGTGKTYLAMAMAISALKEEKVSRIVLTRPAVEAGEALGFLPGDLYEKITPYLRPLHDALYDMLPGEEIEKHMQKGTIEVAPLAYMRGRTLNNSFIILDESQNSTTEQMFMFLTRLGMNSKAVITGDPTQVDLPSNRNSGLIEATRILKSVKGIALIEFTKKDIVRHHLVQRIIEAYEEHRGKQQHK